MTAAVILGILSLIGILVLAAGVFVLTSDMEGIRNEVLDVKNKVDSPPSLPPVQIDLSTVEKSLTGEMKKIPDFVLQSLTGTANAEKGKLGELIGYLTLKAEYDKIIPLGGIVDFMGIKFPSKDGTSKGHIDFIDIKTGKGARLTPDQRKLKKLLDANSVNFRTIKVDDIETK